MKTVTIILGLLFAACVTVAAVVLLTSGVTVTMTGITARSASEDPELFAQVLAGMGENADLSQEDITDCTFYTWHVEVNNNTFVRLEMVETAIETVVQDISFIGERKEINIDPHSKAELTITILTRAVDHPKRNLTVSWYLWGKADRRVIPVQ
ncbi:MAG: hypothetical protein IK127_00895 [Clostridia bacterium]|nr:hypothetical protein [Clostridia bacterium]